MAGLGNRWAPDAPEGSGEGRRIVYCISCQQVWLVEEDDWVYWSYPVSGRRAYPTPGPAPYSCCVV